MHPPFTLGEILGEILGSRSDQRGAACLEPGDRHTER
jgi:hypothetical protein